MELWERFSASAKQSALAANAIAKTAKSPQIGTDHLLRGLLSIPDSGASAVLRRMNVDAAGLLATLETGAVVADEAPAGDITFTMPAQRALQRAYAAARERGEKGIGSEHVLFGLLQAEPDEWPELPELLGVPLGGAKAAFAAVREAGEGDGEP